MGKLESRDEFRHETNFPNFGPEFGPKPQLSEKELAKAGYRQMLDDIFDVPDPVSTPPDLTDTRKLDHIMRVLGLMGEHLLKFRL
jgi:hypothetical protein